MVRNVKIFFAALLLVCVQSFAGYFIEQSYDETPAKDSLSSLSFGGELELVYYLSSIHPGFLLSGEYRFHKHHSADLFAVALFSGDYFELGADWRFFFRGLREDDFLRLGFSFISFERYDKSYFPPRITLGYGRDITFFKNASFLCRIELDASYIIGRALVEHKDDDLFGRESHFAATLNIGFYLF
ncbi:MAG: hypothetical protein IJM92_12530 [Fibrobacter sp.]|uniref:hypothetical protein n=1 Tax=Fibrobacter sp. TaxID=35828 RepID=UPI0025C61668|nr:hypothetical protein [Fibrobacter sp.]MBQ7080453.1 hypothetical protein [Fibrobacter sp.]